MRTPRRGAQESQRLKSLMIRRNKGSRHTEPSTKYAEIGNSGGEVGTQESSTKYAELE